MFGGRGFGGDASSRWKQSPYRLETSIFYENNAVLSILKLKIQL